MCRAITSKSCCTGHHKHRYDIEFPFMKRRSWAVADQYLYSDLIHAETTWKSLINPNFEALPGGRPWSANTRVHSLIVKAFNRIRTHRSVSSSTLHMVDRHRRHCHEATSTTPSFHPPLYVLKSHYDTPLLCIGKGGSGYCTFHLSQDTFPSM